MKDRRRAMKCHQRIPTQHLRVKLTSGRSSSNRESDRPKLCTVENVDFSSELNSSTSSSTSNTCKLFKHPDSRRISKAWICVGAVSIVALTSETRNVLANRRPAALAKPTISRAPVLSWRIKCSHVGMTSSRSKVFTEVNKFNNSTRLQLTVISERLSIKCTVRPCRLGSSKSTEDSLRWARGLGCIEDLYPLPTHVSITCSS